MSQPLSIQTPASVLQAILRVLTNARKLLTPRPAWATNAFAYDKDNHEIHHLNKDAVCWCLTGVIWKTLDDEINLPIGNPWAYFSHSLTDQQKKAAPPLSKKLTSTTMLTFQHVASHIPDSRPPVSSQSSFRTCHDLLSNFNDAACTKHVDMLLLLDKGAADIQALLHQQQGLQPNN